MKQKINKPKLLIVALFSLFFLFSYSIEKKGEQTAMPSSKEAPFSNIVLEAKSAYVFDILKQEPVFELNPEAQLPLASLTKIMSAVAAKENIPEWLLVDIGREAIMQEGDRGFLVGEKWPINRLIEAMLISSSNDAAAALAECSENGEEGAFVNLMNEKARELGLNQTYFLNPTGLDVSGNIAGAYGSAKDMAKLMEYAVKNHPSMFEPTRYSMLEINSRLFKNTNVLTNEIPGIIGGKTGSSDLAGGNLAVVFDAGFEHPVVIVVLGSTEEGRFEDVKKLYSESFKSLGDL